MKKLCFDIETNMAPKSEWNNNFVKNVRSLACLCIIDVDTGDQFTYHDNPELPRTGTNIEGIHMLLEADLLIGHNIKGFDIPALQLIYPEYAPALDTRIAGDTLASCRTFYSWGQLEALDKKLGITRTEYNKKSPNSLGSWGARLVATGKLELPKDEEYKKNVDWTNITIDQNLLDYCMQDVVVNIALYKQLRLERNLK